MVLWTVSYSAHELLCFRIQEQTTGHVRPTTSKQGLVSKQCQVLSTVFACASRRHTQLHSSCRRTAAPHVITTGARHKLAMILDMILAKRQRILYASSHHLGQVSAARGTIGSLDEDALLEIFKFLSEPRTLLAATQVCSAWRRVATKHSTRLWCHMDVYINSLVKCRGEERALVTHMLNVDAKPRTIVLHDRHGKLGHDAAAHLLSGLPLLAPSLVNLSIQECDLPPSGVQMFIRALPTLRGHLEALDLTGVPMSNEAAADFFRELPGLGQSLQELSLRGTGIGDQAVIALAKVLPNFGIRMRQLDLGENTIGPRGGMALARSLPSLRALEHLDLYDNPYTTPSSSEFDLKAIEAVRRACSSSFCNVIQDAEDVDESYGCDGCCC